MTPDHTAIVPSEATLGKLARSRLPL